jgi:hypothetical protein
MMPANDDHPRWAISKTKDRASLREQCKRRRNFIEVLDRLGRDRIIGGKK